MFIIFLDIDGVLVTARAMRIKRELGLPASAKHGAAFDSEAVEVFNRFIKKTHAKVVVSSTWRYGETVFSMQNILTRNGVECKVIGFTERSPRGIRGLEIKKWLRCNPWEDYVVIDDDCADINRYIPKKHFIHVANGIMGAGLTEEHVKEYYDRSNRKG